MNLLPDCNDRIGTVEERWADVAEFILRQRRVRAEAEKPACYIDEKAADLLPNWFRWPDESPSGWFVNRSFVLQSGEDQPQTVGDVPHLSGLTGEAPRAWIRHPISGGWMPLCLEPRLAQVAASLTAGAAAPQDFPPEVKRLLAAAGILVCEDELSSAPCEAFCQPIRKQFVEQLYSPLPPLIHPFHLATLRKWYRRLVTSHAMRLGDSATPLRFGYHNEPAAQFFHHQLTDFVSCAVGELVKPSYVYLASYVTGSVLPPHKDRPQCEFSLSMLIDYTPEPIGPTDWPLCVHRDGTQAPAAISQELGQSLLYRGTALTHFRDALPDGRTSTSLFFHYVPIDFADDLD